MHLVALPQRWWSGAAGAGAGERGAAAQPGATMRRTTRTYGELFQHLAATQGAVCLALRRESMRMPAASALASGLVTGGGGDGGDGGDGDDSDAESEASDFSDGTDEDFLGGTEREVAASKEGEAARRTPILRGPSARDTALPPDPAGAAVPALQLQPGGRIASATSTPAHGTAGEAPGGEPLACSEADAERCSAAASDGVSSLPHLASTCNASRARARSRGDGRQQGEEAARAHAHARELRHCLPYVYTNPKAKTRLRAGDAVFVLCAVDPRAWPTW